MNQELLSDSGEELSESESESDQELSILSEQNHSDHEINDATSLLSLCDSVIDCNFQTANAKLLEMEDQTFITN